MDAKHGQCYKRYLDLDMERSMLGFILKDKEKMQRIIFTWSVKIKVNGQKL